MFSQCSKVMVDSASNTGADLEISEFMGLVVGYPCSKDPVMTVMYGLYWIRCYVTTLPTKRTNSLFRK